MNTVFVLAIVEDDKRGPPLISTWAYYDIDSCYERLAQWCIDDIGDVEEFLEEAKKAGMSFADYTEKWSSKKEVRLMSKCIITDDKGGYKIDVDSFIKELDNEYGIVWTYDISESYIEECHPYRSRVYKLST